MKQSSKDLFQEATRFIRRGKGKEAIRMLQLFLQSNPGDEIACSILGSALLREGDTENALAVFRSSVLTHPESYAAQGDLGFACLKSGDTSGAIDAFESAVNLNSGFYPGWCFLSRVRYEAGQTEKSRQALANSERCDPFVSQFQTIQSAMSTSRFAEAEKIARAILAKQPGYPRAAYALAHLASRVGAHEEAAEILQFGLQHYPADIHLRVALVNSYEEAGRYQDAIEQAEAATGLDPESFAIWQVRGRVYGHCGAYEESLASYDRALQCKNLGEKDSSNLALLRGHVLKILGRQEESVEAYRKSTESTHGAGAGWWGLADMKTFRFSKADTSAMQAFVNNTSFPVAQRSQAAFALGKAKEDEKCYNKAFEWYALANTLRPDIEFSGPDFHRTMDRLIEAFTPELLAHQTTTPVNGPTPIFVVGLPRSGSTLIEQILASHSQIEGTMELVNLPNVLRRITIDGGKRNLDYPDSLLAFSSEELAAYGQSYMDSTAVYRTGKPFFIDKLPPNFDKVGLLHMILPHAIIIDARRHPMDCGFSSFKQHFAGGHHFSYKLQNIGAYYNGYLKIMDHWNAVLPGKVACIQYETTVRETEATVRRLLAHCGVPFEDACLRFFDNTRPVRTASSEQVRQPIYQEGVAHWKHFETYLTPLAQALGQETLARFDNVHTDLP
ncbi:MAG: sulfotransferase [Gammaproteobacteria bacterium]|nr:sulfotransferase [Gammaproteobacteria bacterium]